MKKNIQSLAGITVLDLSRLIPGPFCSRVLCDQGAKVIKVENPELPDTLNFFSKSLYQSLNKNKKIVVCTYSKPSGKKEMEHLVRKADVLIESFRPGILSSMGWSVKTLHKINPRLIIVSITGYGQTGANKMKAGHDVNYLAMSGILSKGAASVAPTLSGIQWADLVGGGMFGALAIVSALLQRGKKGQGKHLDVSMTDNMKYFVGAPLAAHQGRASPAPTILSGALARYNIYKTSDDRFVALGALEEKFWNRFCDCVGLSDLKSSGDYPDLSEEVHQRVKDLFATKTWKEWKRLGEQNDICLTPLL